MKKLGSWFAVVWAAIYRLATYQPVAVAAGIGIIANVLAMVHVYTLSASQIGWLNTAYGAAAGVVVWLGVKPMAKFHAWVRQLEELAAPAEPGAQASGAPSEGQVK